MPRPGLLALAMLVWLTVPFGARSAQATGCHVPDRAVLGVDERGSDEFHAWTPSDRVAPPVLTRLPCPGETPATTTGVILPTGPACLSAMAIQVESASGCVLAVEDVGRGVPHPFRLDRPPR